MKKIIAIAAIAAASITTAHAEESNFAGAKIGVVGGYDEYEMSILTESIGKKSGFVYGVTAGYDFDLGGAIAGVEVEAADSTGKLQLGDEFSLRAGRKLYAGVRLGAKLSPKLAAYAKGGYTNSRMISKVEDEKFGTNRDGYLLGAGLEYAPSTYFSRVEYRYSDYGRYSVEGEDTGLSGRRHQIVATVGTRF